MSEISRRGFLSAILAAGAAPMIVKFGILMPVKKIVVPDLILPKVRGRGMTTPIFQIDEGPWQSESPLTQARLRELTLQRINQVTLECWKKSAYLPG